MRCCCSASDHLLPAILNRRCCILFALERALVAVLMSRSAVLELNAGMPVFAYLRAHGATGGVVVGSRYVREDKVSGGGMR